MTDLSELTEVRIHGRGGQGVVTCGELLALAANFEDKFCRSFPLYGAQRRGSPLISFVSIGREEFSTRSQIVNPNYIIVLDPYLPKNVDIKIGLRENGTIIYNTNEDIDNAYNTIGRPNVKDFAVIDATSIALASTGKPIPNTIMAAAFAKVSGIISLDSILKGIRRRFTGEVAEKNITATIIGYEKVIVRKFR